MRKLLLLALASAAAFVGSRFVKSYLLAANLPERRPFVAEVREDRYDPDGKLQESITYTHARRGDGSRVTIYQQLDPNGNRADTKEILDLAARKEISTNGLTESTSTTSISDRRVQWEQTKETQCNFKNTGESSVLFGLPVYHVRLSRPDNSTIDTWEAPNLGCYPVKLEGVKQMGDGRRVVTTRQVISLVLTEPAPTLFNAPEWREMDPRATDDEYDRRYGKHLFSERALQKLQTLYEQRHKQ